MNSAVSTGDVPTVSRQTWASLGALLLREIGFLKELGEVLLVQRDAIAISDGVRVDESVEKIALLLDTLSVAKKDRQTLMGGLLGPGQKLSDFVVAQLYVPKAVGDRVTELKIRAEAVTRDTEINHRILSATIRSGEVFLRTVIDAATEQEPAYAASGSPADQSASPVFLNRTA